MKDELKYFGFGLLVIVGFPLWLTAFVAWMVFGGIAGVGFVAHEWWEKFKRGCL